MSLDIQFYLLIHTILYGIFLGLSFDTTNLIIQYLKNKIIRDLLIILYWAAQLPLAVLFFHRVNQGKFQSYLLIFVLIGGGIYFKFFQKKYLEEFKILLKICHRLYIGTKKVLNVLIFVPIGFIFQIVFDIIDKPRKIFKKRFGKNKARSEQDGEVQSH